MTFHSPKITGVVTSVDYLPVSEETRVGYGRPYITTYTLPDGQQARIRGVETWREPAPDLGGTMTLPVDVWEYWQAAQDCDSP